MIAQLTPLYIKTRPTKAVSRLISYALFEGRPLTTKGRWINPLVFSLLKLEKRMPQIKKVVKPIFIIGSGRSGSTILGTLLSMHRDVGFLNEPKAIWHNLYPYEDVIGNYTQAEAFYRLGAAHSNEGIRRAAHRIFGAYLTATASSRLVDKYPELVFRVPFVRAIFPDARFIFLIRNGWDTCVSIDKWSKRNGVAAPDELHDWWGLNNRKWKLMLDELVSRDPDLSRGLKHIRSLADHTQMAAVEWVVTMREGFRQKKRFPDSVYIFKYEDLCNSPRQALGGLLKFCELPEDEKFYSYAEGVLTPNPTYERFDVDPVVLPAFEKTLSMAGY